MALEPWIVGVGRREQVLVLVVCLVSVEDSGGTPVLDGAGVHVQPLGYLLDGEHSGGAESVVAAG